MNVRPSVRRVLSIGALLGVAVIAWGTLSGAIGQISRSLTAGQRIETALQFVCSLLSMLVIVTCRWQRHWAVPLRRTWSGMLAITAGLSALVWGPPMVSVALAFALCTLLVALAIVWALR